VDRSVYEIGDGQWDVPELRRLLDELLPANQGVDDFEVEHDFMRVGRKTILLNARKLRRLETQEDRILLVLEAVTERRRIQRQLVTSNEDLKHFAIIASHDLQAPLRSISGFADLLVRWYKGRLDTDADEFLSYILAGAEAMRSLISELLAYARAAAHDRDVQSVPSSEVLHDVVANLTTVIEESHASIESETLPIVNFDASQLTQVFQNLLDNAIKYRKPDHPLRVHQGVPHGRAAGSGPPQHGRGSSSYARPLGSGTPRPIGVRCTLTFQPATESPEDAGSSNTVSIAEVAPDGAVRNAKKFRIPPHAPARQVAVP
jgi:signal transduction histidine kinase